MRTLPNFILTMALGVAFAMALGVSGCSKPDNSLLLEAIAEQDKGNNDAAMTLYQRVIDEYPDSDGAPEAMFRLAALTNEHKSDPLKAATLYEDIYVKYPKSEYGHRGLFLAGFIYNNDLQNFDRAKRAYEKYVEVYADSSFAKEAQFELLNLGKTPDEILQSLRDTLKEEPPPAHDMETFQ